MRVGGEFVAGLEERLAGGAREGKEMCCTILQIKGGSVDLERN